METGDLVGELVVGQLVLVERRVMQWQSEEGAYTGARWNAPRMNTAVGQVGRVGRLDPDIGARLDFPGEVSPSGFWFPAFALVAVSQEPVEVGRYG